MPKKANPWAGYSKAIGEIFDKQHEENIKLTPHRNELENIVGLASAILKDAITMKNVSDMAHQDMIIFEMAQEIMDGTKLRIKESMGYLQTYLRLEDKIKCQSSQEK